MPILYQHQVVRKPGFLSDSETKKYGFLSHEEKYYSSRICKWCGLAKQNYKEMVAAMNSFLRSEAAITSIHQLPEEMHSCIRYGLEHIDDFKTEEFLANTDFKRFKDYLTEGEDGTINPESPILNYLNRCADTTIAITITGNYINKRFDEKRVFKLIWMLSQALVIEKEKFRVNGVKYLERPFILNVPCIMEADSCLPDTSNVELPIIENEEDDCPCTELKRKEHACNCEDNSIDPCDCKCDDECVEQNPCCAEITPFVAELFIVKDEVSCYKAGEISYIENVMKGELRERKHRHFQREEIYTEREEENNTFEERDKQVDERFSLHKEIDKVVETDLSVDAGASYSYGVGAGKTGTSFSSSLDVSYNQSRKDARRIVQDESKNVVRRALKRVEQKVRTFTSKRLINEIEERNKHSFDGTGFSDNYNGIYFYANQERKAQVYSYGMREMLDFYVPDPSARLKRLLEKEFKLKKPIKPCLHIEDINSEDYLKYIQCYGFSDLERPPKQIEYVDFVVKGRHEIGKKGNAGLHKGQTQFTVPDNYEAVSMEIVSKSVTWDGNGGVSILIQVGDGEVFLRYNDPDQDIASLDKLVGTQIVDFQAWDAVIYNINVRVKCELKSELALKWQIDVFNRIMQN